MKRFWEKILSTFTAPMPKQTENREDIVLEHAMRIRRKMAAGTWQFSWGRAGRTKLVVVHANLPSLIEVIRSATAAIDIGAGLPLEARRSPHSNLGVNTPTLKDYLADDKGFYQKPDYLARWLVDETEQLCGAISRQRNKNPVRAEALEGQCVYLLNEVEYLVKILL